MKNVYAFESIEDYRKYEGIIKRFRDKLEVYQRILEAEYELVDPPKGIVWTSKVLATSVFSSTFAPAYTNENAIYFSPDLEGWKELFLKQLEGRKNNQVEMFYENMTENHLFEVLAHELTHHSDLFVDDFDDELEDSIWFEEGMCFYLPRKIMLSEEEFKGITDTEHELVEMFKGKYGGHSLDEFGKETYEGSLTSIMFDYWRSYLAVKYVVEVRANNDVKQVFKEYHKWDKEGRKVPLAAFFEVNNLFN
ncbi:hypothetical protein [Virgibacillus doumboii]|uniref:hypothetical protein n=1 Tax=Virgibacillus doumboii TaxID=2697503 RepID=UPI0013E0922D|nr:hypothetical protein [Virgibacillus doumboii]